ncbi:hypothetical protein [Phytoactinopolyspora halotolerans]|uniref:Uncharacterized protein n=1 Tax=Phytoactinopolyspora halotolerans TaxID=1981512 RepID=A0A6L9S347_9ACTN|nr:hypothetical protein [Phytoactinopolyspora halotolerans]NED99053.1 hypothetical protein [Phytoactinopolyspora halotolerans]
MDDRTSWREQRRAAYAAHAAALERQKAAETAQARELLSDFVRAVRAQGIQPVRLRARVPDTRATYRTGLTGWYLRRNGSLAVSVDEDFYILDTPASLRSRLFGVQPAPSDPPLVVGKGARDGESMPLEQLLRQRLEAGEEWD